MSTTENNYQETDLGNVSLNPRGEYDPGASYEYLDTVSYQGGSYTCLAELGTTITGIAPDPGRNTDAWQMLTLPGDLKPEYIAMHDDMVNHARQAESSRLAAELAQQAAEDAQADIQQLHTDTRQAATEAGQSRDSAAGYAQSADASRKAAAESEQNINAQVTDFDTKVSESVTQAQEEIVTTRQQAIRAVASQQVTSIQAVKDQTASYITEKETSAKTEIGNCTSEKIAEINKKASEANTTLANTIADGTSLKTQLETTISTADTSKKNLDASNTAAGKTQIALDTSNTTATKTKADLDASNTTASEAKTGLDATNKTAADLVASLGDKITEGTQVKTDIQTTGETAMSNLQAEAKKQQEYIKTSIDDTLSISGKAADAAVTGKKIDSLKEDLSNKITKFYASNQGEIHITDSDNGKIQDMMLYGKSEQNQYKGINLLPADISYLETIEVLIPKGTHIFWATDGTPALGGNFRFRNEDSTQETWFGVDAGKTAMTSTINIDAKYIDFLISKDQSVKICLGIGDDPVYEPYTGGQPSPSPDYPQEIKSVVNPTVKISSENETESQTVTLPYTLNAIPVSSDGNVTINGQQYIADYADVKRGKLVKMVDSSKLDNTQSIMGKTEWLLVEPQEIDLTQEEMQTLKTLATYYPTTNIFINSEQLDGYTVFNYPISMENDWNHVKQQIGDMREDFVNLKEYVKGANLPETWEQVVLAIKSKLYKEMYAVGDKFSNIWKDTNNSNKEYDNPLRINHFEDGLELEDGTTVNGMWLQTVYAHLKGVQFSHQQAFYVSGDGMVAGTYCVGFDYTWGDKGYVTKGDYWNFTLTKDVPAGGRLAGFYGAPDQPQTNWRVYVYSADGKTVLETVSAINKGQEGTLLGVMTAYGDENLNGIQQMAYGDNRYATSAIRQYLNSDKPKGEWWTAQTKWDIAPDQLSQIDGYLCGMDPELLAVLKPVKVVTYCNTVTATGQKQVKDITYDKVTLISLEQMYIEPQAAGEGEAHEYYKELNGTAKKFQWWQTYEILKTFAVENPTSPQYVRLRSAARSYACSTWYVSSSGGVSNYAASSAHRPAPLMFIGAAPSDTISAPTDAESTQEDKSQEAVA